MAKGWGETNLFAQREHAHLRLTTALSPQPRRRRPPGGGGKVAFPDRAAHAKRLRDEAAAIVSRHRRRADVLGINPDLVLIFVLNVPVAGIDKILSTAGLEFLAATGSKIVAAFASDPDLAEFLEHLEDYSKGIQPGAKSARYESIFDKIVAVRTPAAEDILDDDLWVSIRDAPSSLLRVDVQCWCPEPEQDARRRFDETVAVVDSVDGQIVDKSFRYQAGLSLIRADLPAARISSVAALGRVRRISLLPRPLLTLPEVVRAGHTDLPIVVPPAADAPLLAVIDSGVRADHPMIELALAETHHLGAGIPNGGDSHGHGTLVASLALYGQLEGPLHARSTLQAAGRLLSVRVLDEEAAFPDADLWIENLAAAVEWAAARGARVVNISVGDDRHPFVPPMAEPAAARIDELIRQYGIVVVISTGNFPAGAYPAEPRMVSEYPTWLLEHDLSGLLPPAAAALALTVGGEVADQQQGAQPVRDTADVATMGRPGEPSALTRIGPGIESMIKPELVASAGTYSYESMTNRLTTPPQNKVIGAAAGPVDRLLAADLGTSFAAPLASHAALRVLGRYPFLSHNGVRALLLATAEQVGSVLSGGTDSERREADLRLTGYGRVSARRAEFSEDYRTVPLAEETIGMDQVHFYSVPIPRAFFEAGRKQISLGLAFDPPVRATRLAYLSNRLSVYVYRGVTVDEVRARYATHLEDDEPPEDLAKFLCQGLQPADRKRLLGANQAATQLWEQKRWDEKYRGRLVVAVRNTNRWAVDDHAQHYALALALRVAEGVAASIYVDLRAELPLLAELETELEV